VVTEAPAPPLCPTLGCPALPTPDVEIEPGGAVTGGELDDELHAASAAPSTSKALFEPVIDRNLRLNSH
jgi:hypothetical protein